jgi:hypothetical protein
VREIIDVTETKITTITLPRDQIDKVEKIVTDHHWIKDGNNLALYSNEG